ncbi:hypothetical protein [Streptomyces sp. AN091965]|uniref:hypothetical protein n=1 Tax=Streptomyces sp. AN091965 TaxID=2927803 RepID=UPI001F61A98C|nr:hypothetical protein [Streptomyces sp. AN091965]MCI3928826.1 hypothetical protein [Streptomyces sp. AN091965]
MFGDLCRPMVRDRRMSWRCFGEKTKEGTRVGGGQCEEPCAGEGVLVGRTGRCDSSIGSDTKRRSSRPLAEEDSAHPDRRPIVQGRLQAALLRGRGCREEHQLARALSAGTGMVVQARACDEFSLDHLKRFVHVRRDVQLWEPTRAPCLEEPLGVSHRDDEFRSALICRVLRGQKTDQQRAGGVGSTWTDKPQATAAGQVPGEGLAFLHGDDAEISFLGEVLPRVRRVAVVLAIVGRRHGGAVDVIRFILVRHLCACRP